jgi:hypothetical protein
LGKVLDDFITSYSFRFISQRAVKAWIVDNSSYFVIGLNKLKNSKIFLPQFASWIFLRNNLDNSPQNRGHNLKNRTCLIWLSIGPFLAWFQLRKKLSPKAGGICLAAETSRKAVNGERKYHQAETGQLQVQERSVDLESDQRVALLSAMTARNRQQGWVL